MPMKGALQTIEAEVTAWEGVVAAPHRFGGREYRFGTRELGHLHGDGWADLPFPVEVRDELIAAAVLGFLASPPGRRLRLRMAGAVAGARRGQDVEDARCGQGLQRGQGRQALAAGRPVVAHPQEHAGPLPATQLQVHTAPAGMGAPQGRVYWVVLPASFPSS